MEIIVHASIYKKLVIASKVCFPCVQLFIYLHTINKYVQILGIVTSKVLCTILFGSCRLILMVERNNIIHASAINWSKIVGMEIKLFAVSRLSNDHGHLLDSIYFNEIRREPKLKKLECCSTVCVLLEAIKGSRF